MESTSTRSFADLAVEFGKLYTRTDQFRIASSLASFPMKLLVDVKFK